MKRFPQELRRAKLLNSHPANKGPALQQIEQQSLEILGLARVLKELGHNKHSKCSKRLNVISAVDFVVSERAGLKLDEEILKETPCPFSTTQGCSLINNGLTVPGICAKRIVKENPELLSLEPRLLKAYKFIHQLLRLFVGAKK